MRVLLDTHVWLWMQSSPSRLSTEARALVADTGTERLLSVVSVWEIVIKHALGRLPLPDAPRHYVPSRLRTSVTTVLSTSLAHVLEVADLREHHRDPFDRLLVAQARIEDVPLLTADETLAAYDVERVTAT